MKKPTIMLQTSLNFSQVLYKALEFHLPEGAIIIDPTPGEKHSWKYYLGEAGKKNQFHPLVRFEIQYIPDNIENYKKTREYVKQNGSADGIFFDPPYIFGLKNNQARDSRERDYGGYYHSFDSIKKLIEIANNMLPKFLKESGLLFFKYTDVFSLEERKFYPCFSIWPGVLSNFEIVDHYIVRHSHVSPTAWQVKDRPCGIVNYTYLTVFRFK